MDKKTMLTYFKTSLAAS